MNRVFRGTLKSIWKLTCPRCRKGHLFEQPFTLKMAYKMPSNCPTCTQRYEPEPGFYYGSMFISYALSGFFMLLVGFIAIVGFNWTLYPTFAMILALAVLSHTFTFRLSRSIWIHVVVRHDPKWNKHVFPNS